MPDKKISGYTPLSEAIDPDNDFFDMSNMSIPESQRVTLNDIIKGGYDATWGAVIVNNDLTVTGDLKLNGTKDILGDGDTRAIRFNAGGTTFNQDYLDKNFQVRKLTSGFAILYDASADALTFDVPTTISSTLDVTGLTTLKESLNIQDSTGVVNLLLDRNTAIANGNGVGFIRVGSTLEGITDKRIIDFIATEDWDLATTKAGTKINLRVITNGTDASVLSLLLDQDLSATFKGNIIGEGTLDVSELTTLQENLNVLGTNESELSGLYRQTLDADAGGIGGVGGQTSQSEDWIGFTYESVSDATPYWHKIAIIGENSGTVHIRGLLSGHTSGKGRKYIDITIVRRDGLNVFGTINGEVSNWASDILIYSDTTGNDSIYLKTNENFVSINLDIKTVGAASVVREAKSSSAPSVNTPVLDFTLSTDFTGNTIDENGNLVSNDVELDRHEARFLDTAGGQDIDGTERTLTLANDITNPMYSLSSNVITLSEAGTYKIDFKFGFITTNTGGSARGTAHAYIQADDGQGGGFVAIDDGHLASYAREENGSELTNLISPLYRTVFAGTEIRIRFEQTDGNVNIETGSNHSSVQIVKLRN